MAMKVKVGDIAPDFTLIGSDFKPLTLSDHKGKSVILTFYPAAFSGGPEQGCEFHLCSLAPIHESGAASVIAVSVDLPFANAAFAQKLGTPYPLLSDPNFVVCNLYTEPFEFGNFLNDVGVTTAAFRGVKSLPRALFVICPEGKIKYAWQGENAGKMPPFADVKAIL